MKQTYQAIRKFLSCIIGKAAHAKFKRAVIYRSHPDFLLKQVY